MPQGMVKPTGETTLQHCQTGVDFDLAFQVLDTQYRAIFAEQSLVSIHYVHSGPPEAAL